MPEIAFCSRRKFAIGFWKHPIILKFWKSAVRRFTKLLPIIHLNLPNENVAPERIFGEQIFLHHIADKAVWEISEIEKFESRDTGISKATGGLADVQTLRAIADARFSVKHSDEFLFFFVLKGNLQLSNEGNNYFVEKGGSFVLPAEREYCIDAAKGLEMIRVCLPVEH